MGQFGIGQAIRRTEDQRFLTGTGTYTDDIALDRQVHAVVVRSPFAHARIAGIDTSVAKDMAGVLAVWTHADLAADGVGSIPCLASVTNRDGSAHVAPPRPALADGAVRFVGDPVAVVIAESRAEAAAAAEAVEVEYEELTSVTSTAGAVASNAPQLWAQAPGNLCFDWEAGDREGADRAFSAAAHVTRIELVNNRIVPTPMEPRVAIGDWDDADGRYILYSPSQGPHSLRRQLASAIFNVDEDRVRVVTPDVGGGFGMKIFLYPEQVLVTWAARKLNRPVRWTSERGEAFLSDNHGRDHVTEAEIAFDGDNRILGVRVSTIANLGAYLSNMGPYVATSAGAAMLAGVYRTPVVHNAVRGVFTNTAPVDAYRGAGRPEANYVIERLMDAAARDLGVDAAELRRRNFIAPDQMPYRTAMGATYDSGDFARNLDEALARAGWADRETRRREAEARGQLLGTGLSYYIESCGGAPDERATIGVDGDGAVTLSIGTMSNGQGHETAYAQIIADRLGIDIDRIRVVQGDTDAIEYGRGTAGSRSLPVGGVATMQAADLVVEKGRRIAAHLLEAADGDIEYMDGVFRIAGTDRRADLFEVARAAADGLALPDGLKDGLNAASQHMPGAPTFPNGCHVCEVEVDRDTGAFRIVRYVVVDDFGTVLNPLLLAGQVYGGIGQGLGQAIHERCVYDADSGQLLTGSFMDYGIPRADDLPMIDFSYNEIPSTTNPMGLKGAGEAGTIGATPAVINALVDALAPFGIRHIDMPVTREAIWRVVQERRAA